VPGPERDSQRQANRHPARVDKLGEVLAGQIGAERVRRGRAPAPRTAVPIAWNSWPPNGNSPAVSDTLTVPCPPNAAHSAIIRPIALCLAS
jgi:hypothetical protein